MGKNRSRKRKSKLKLMILLLIAFLLLGLSLTVALVFKVKDIEYSGNQHYKNEELTQSIFHGKSPNALLYFLYQKNYPADIPFVQKYDVEIEWPDKMNITIYEKPVIGYVNYMGCNMFFDKDGVIVESSTKTLSGVPQVTGLNFKSIILNAKLEVGDSTVFSKILELTQSFDKYKITVDKIFFDSSNEIVLYMEQVKVQLGDCENLVDKLYKLKQVSPELQGLKGTLHLENYTEDAPNIIFKKEK